MRTVGKEIVELDKEIDLIVSKELQQQILYAHSKVGNIEWSGFLLYKELEGSIDGRDKMVLKAEYVHVLDIGTAGYTEFTLDENIIDMYDEYPEAMACKVGIIHTHHNMKTFFSGTDTGELQDNADKYPYYVSLIVNHVGDYCAKVAFVATRNRGSISFLGKKINLPSDEVLCTIDCNIVLEAEDTFSARISSLKAANTKRSVKKFETKDSISFRDFGSSRQGNLWDDTKPSRAFSKVESEITTDTVSSFLVKFLSQDLLSESSLGTVCTKINKELLDKDEEIDIYVEMLDSSYLKYCEDIFNVTSKADISKISRIAGNLIEKYCQVSPMFEVSGIFDVYIEEAV